MEDAARPLALRVLRWSAVAIVLLVCARTAWRRFESFGPTRLSKPLQRSPLRPSLWLLIVGDNTFVGSGATAPQARVARPRDQRFPRLQIGTQAREGANSFQSSCRNLTAMNASTWGW